MVTNSNCLTKRFINLLMVAGKKSRAYKIFYAAAHQFLLLTKKGKKSIKDVAQERSLHLLGKKNPFLWQLEIAVKNVQPNIEARKCRVAGSTKLIPVVVSRSRGETLALRWIIESAKNRKRKSRDPFYQCLAHEFLDAYEKQGMPRLRRDETHKLCSANRGHLRYRWW